MRMFPVCLACVLMLTASACSRSGSGAADACLSTAETALDASWTALGSPPDTSRASLEKVVAGARDALSDAVSGTSGSSLSTSILDGKIRVWARCDDEEGSRDWTPGN